ncbi:hypothetical protein GSJ18_02390 [Bordetella pertussis]|uniref:hypothetical protein n=1 Tax=Bordetella pertussis TaxID=520 RepID=UPI0003D1BB75|nr:hypothetical protein [Bordetella pertussis]ETA64157.1 hypothetical protein V483_2768 [Bordetella pertussis CHLA-11]ETH20174.1 hypothetical protein L563_2724 [Bordetella pertussis CHLA-13]ETH39674.1 hypothetical protein L547_3145 [Bordetella pertussis H918]ETH46968.1 hypothetical protein L548_3282 [Bordetella pertussis H921]ETH53770.1 hypothetical protein L552_3042 [Bordetella pertussis I002]ETH70144.1 hypothetical protein L545_3065 [Bordetella pertussis STO1-CHLA-0011]ETH80705.1 hypotheti
MNWEVGDFQFLKSGSDEPCIQPIESSQVACQTVSVPAWRQASGTVAPSASILPDGFRKKPASAPAGLQ